MEDITPLKAHGLLLAGILLWAGLSVFPSHGLLIPELVGTRYKGAWLLAGLAWLTHWWGESYEEHRGLGLTTSAVFTCLTCYAADLVASA